MSSHAGCTQVVANGFRHIGGYDFHTGQQLWRLDGGGDVPVPTPIFAHGLIFITSTHRPRDSIYAIRAEATGDMSLRDGQRTNAFMVWRTPRGGNYMQTPIVVGNHLCYCSNARVLVCYEARTGKPRYRERLGGCGAGGFTPSAVPAAGRLYCSSERGMVYVVRISERFEVLATAALGEACLAAAALADEALFFRSRHHVVALGAAPEGK